MEEGRLHFPVQFVIADHSMDFTIFYADIQILFLS